MCRTFKLNLEPESVTIGQRRFSNVRQRSSTWPNPIKADEKFDHDMDLEETCSELFDGFDMAGIVEPDEFFGLNFSNLTDIMEESNNLSELPSSSKITPQSPESTYSSTSDFSSKDLTDDVIMLEEKRGKTDLQKVCGFQSYQHIIEKAINSSDEKHLTLNQIYAWVEENVPYFRKMSEANNSKSWKNSIRHNLSLHKQFYKVLREGNRSCLWGCDRNRILRNKEMTKNTPKVKKISQPAPIQPMQPVQSATTFRPRAQTEPNMVKSTFAPKILLQISESDLPSKTVYNSLTARFQTIEDRQKTSSGSSINFLTNTQGSNFNETQQPGTSSTIPSTIQPLIHSPENLTVSFQNSAAGLYHNARCVYLRTIMSEPNTSGSELTGPHSQAGFVQRSFSNPTTSSEVHNVNIQSAAMALDEQAIIDHERSIQGMNYSSDYNI